MDNQREKLEKKVTEQAEKINEQDGQASTQVLNENVGTCWEDRQIQAEKL